MLVLVSLTTAYIPVVHRHGLPVRTALRSPDTTVMKIGSVPATELQKPYDLIVVGGGPAGVAGALKGAYLGKRVLLVDKPKAAPEGGGLDVFFGGPTGLFSKALRDCAKAYDVGSLDAMGLDRDVIFKQVQNSCLRLARNNAQTQGAMLEKFKVGYLQGEATLDLGLFNGRSSTTIAQLNVRLTERPSEVVEISSSKVLLCTGSYASHPPGIPFDNKIVLDSDSVNETPSNPTTLPSPYPPTLTLATYFNPLPQARARSPSPSSPEPETRARARDTSLSPSHEPRALARSTGSTTCPSQLWWRAAASSPSRWPTSSASWVRRSRW